MGIAVTTYEPKKVMEPDEAALWRRVKQGDQKARDTLIQKYIHLVKYVLNRLISLPHVDQEILDFDDLYSCGALGLIAAVDGFDAGREVKFITYAIPRIRGAIIDELRAVDWLPRSLRQKVNRLQKTYQALESELMRPATDEEVSHRMEIEVEDLHRVLDAAAHSAVLSLDEELRQFGEDHTTLQDITKAPPTQTGRETIQRDEMIHILQSSIENLPDKERLVVSMYYYDAMTFKEIGEVLEVTESRVCQLHTRAMLRLRGRLKCYEQEFAATGS